MKNLKLFMLLVLGFSVAACWPRAAEEAEAPVEVVEEQITDAVTDVEGVSGSDELEIEIVEEVE